MRFDVVTLFPELFRPFLETGIFGRSRERGMVEVVLHDLREFGEGAYRKVDDAPYGGGGGMVLSPGPLLRCVHAVRAGNADRGRVVLLSPQGRRLDHDACARLAAEARLILVCGRYEGVDERFVAACVDEEISIGDYVLNGGELPAMVVMEAVARLLPLALGDAAAVEHDSFSDGLLDHPHYTRPEVFEGMEVPEVLRSGDHAAIARWRREASMQATRRKRPDLLPHRGGDDPAASAERGRAEAQDDASGDRATRPDTAPRGRS